MVSNLDSIDLLGEYQRGDEAAAAKIYDRYVGRLLALTRARIGPKLKRKLDPEDVVQSAYRSFFLHARNEHYELRHSGDLWRLLASITCKKLYGAIEKHTAAKRNIGQEQSADIYVAGLQANDLPPVAVIAIAEQLAAALDDLTDDERFVLAATLDGKSIEEVSESMGKSPRSVRRILAGIEKAIENRLVGKHARKKVVTPVADVIEPTTTLEISDYLIEELLGAGGMGKVYRATEKQSGRKVAIKALHKSRQSEPRAVSQFVQEARILAQLRHPNIVGVQGLGRFPGGGFFIVMDYIEGTDLQSRLRQGPLPVAETVSIMKQVAYAIRHAHDNRIVHCDLKPGNILLDRTSHVYVTDFGFAHILAGDSTSSLRSIGGTAGFIAPEILCLSRHPTASADIYSLGVVFWLLATRQMMDVRQLVDERRGELTPVAAICRKCVADDPSQRYGDVAAFLAELERF